MPSSHGKFVWYELMTTDPKSAEDFYSSVVGWDPKDSGMPGMSYTILSAGQTPVGGLMQIPQEAASNGARPAWGGYIAADDVDQYADKVKKAGGTVHRGPADIPKVGRFAVVADPQGAVYMLFKGMEGGQPPAPLAPNAPGNVGWRELHAGEWKSAFDSYSKLFGWTKGEAIDMGPNGTYQLFVIGDAPAGGMLTKQANEPHPYWLYYFNVKGINSALKRVKDKKGEVLTEPMQVPGGSWIIHCRDPQGAMFALVSPEA
ncbi:MAG: VOC family protein [Hyphomicrobiales bacterium]|nr:VOC family protein [Hyphomicrobiales bacterium]MBV9053070.1 VOC family protein [Hyphomicrobiales bacterium]MBV9974001.1 VOC family protein [Hyphomicrobiales bacterium]